MQAVLVMFRSDGERRSFSIARDMTVIGRREDCDLRIPLGDVSRKHCRLVRDGNSLKIEDLGSSNGTYLNGGRVQEAQLSPGDSIQVGPVVFVLQIDGVPADDELSPITVDTAGAAAGAAAGSGMDEATSDESGNAAAAEGGEAVEELEPLEEIGEEGGGEAEVKANAEADADAEPAARVPGGADDSGELDPLEPLEEIEGLEQNFDITDKEPAGSVAGDDLRLDLESDDKRG